MRVFSIRLSTRYLHEVFTQYAMKNLCITQKRNATAYVHVVRGMRKGNQRSLQRVL